MSQNLKVRPDNLSIQEIIAKNARVPACVYSRNYLSDRSKTFRTLMKVPKLMKQKKNIFFHRPDIPHPDPDFRFCHPKLTKMSTFSKIHNCGFLILNTLREHLQNGFSHQKTLFGNCFHSYTHCKVIFTQLCSTIRRFSGYNRRIVLRNGFAVNHISSLWSQACNSKNEQTDMFFHLNLDSVFIPPPQTGGADIP